MPPAPNLPCACHSGIKYKRCCRMAHRGMRVETPEALMRSRYSAFALGLASYVMDSTHPEGPSHEGDSSAWERSILEFSRETAFTGLEILDASEEGEAASVSFRATLRHGAKDVSFTERSRFLRHEGRWLYHSGVLS